MENFNDITFSPAEFARLTKVSKEEISELIEQDLIPTTKKKFGNIERKVITLQGVQDFFTKKRTFEAQNSLGRHGDQIEEHGEGALRAGEPTTVEQISIAPRNKVQMFYNIKGGTGKSTLTTQYVMQAAMMGYKVLGIDLDGQGHLTINMNIMDAHERPTIYDILINDLPIQDAIVNVGVGLDIIPANLGLCNIDIPLNQKPRREYRLGEAIAQIEDQYDLIVADTNPAASILNSSMLVASNLVNVVCATNPLSFHGMSLVMATIQEMEREFRKAVDIRIIPNMYDNREVISQEVLGELQSQFGEHCSKTVVGRSADLNEATKRRTTVWEVNSRGNAANDILALTEELLSL